MIVLHIKLIQRTWTHRFRSRLENTALCIKNHFGEAFPMRNVIKQIGPRTLEIISEQYTPWIISRIQPLQGDITFPAFQIKIKSRPGWV